MPSKEQMMAIGRLLAMSLARRSEGETKVPKKRVPKAKAEPKEPKAKEPKKGKSLKKVSGLAGAGYDEEAKDY
jgi:hypothetical protein